MLRYYVSSHLPDINLKRQSFICRENLCLVMHITGGTIMKSTRMNIAADRLSLENWDGNDVTDYVIALMLFIFSYVFIFPKPITIQKSYVFLKGCLNWALR